MCLSKCQLYEVNVFMSSIMSRIVQYFCTPVVCLSYVLEGSFLAINYLALLDIKREVNPNLCQSELFPNSSRIGPRHLV